MKNLILLMSLSLIFLAPQLGFAHAPSHHAKHNMVLFGDGEVYASHIVYKVPHNFQVILKINFDPQTYQQYSQAKTEHPDSLFVFLLDAMDIGQIESAEALSGTLLYEDVDGSRHTVVSQVSLAKENFHLIYFNELPLSLGGATEHALKVGFGGLPEENCRRIKCP